MRKRSGTRGCGRQATITCVIAALAALVAGAAHAQHWGGRGFLGGPSDAAPLEIAREHLRQHAAEAGLAAADLELAALASQRTNPRTGVSHFFFVQRLHGLDVIGADLGVSVDAEGRVLTRWSRAVADLARRAPSPRAAVSPASALTSAATSFGLASAPADTPAPRLAYRALPDGGVALVWDVVLRTPDGAFWGDVFVDAHTGDVLEKRTWIDADGYRVFAVPLSDPDDGARTLEADPAAPSASPFGWHDTNGVAGAEFTDTRGNNVSAQEDADANNSGGFRPSSGSLVFDFPLDLSGAPASYQSASITNLFYWNNLAHDLFYQYGFDEAAGNFQTNNYGNGGSGGDAVQADSRDGSGTDNANFLTPPDGTAPRMQMYEFIVAGVDIASPPAIAGSIVAGTAEFGPALTPTGVTGTVVQALDAATGTLPSPTDACSPLDNPGAIAGNIALVDRGECLFVDKVQNCQNAGAIGVIIANNVGDGVMTMGGNSGTITIPSVFVAQSTGAAIASELGSGVSATLRQLPNRDSALDTTVVVHEYGHGVSNRLTGGAANVLCLDNSQASGMGEGWSDFLALTVTAQPGDAPTDARPMGAYLVGGTGIRDFPYTTDLGVNPLTFVDAETQTKPHGVGEVWAATLWEAYWKLVGAYGYDPDLFAGSAGNQRALGLVIDGMSLQPCEPTFLTARDAILQADLASTGGADACLLWDAFAKRGLGLNASDQSAGPNIRVTEDFTVPASCLAYCGDGDLQPPEACDDGNRLDFDGCHAVCLPESDFTLEGTAEGGSVGLVIEGVLIEVTTTAGQSAEDVLLALAAAIEADPTLAALGISAQVAGGVLTTGGHLESENVADAGFLPVPQVPGLAPPAGIALLTLLAALRGSATWRRRRSA